MSYLVRFFDNLMEGGEDAESTTMVVKGEREWGQDDRQTDRQGVSAGTVQEHGVSDTHRDTAPGGNCTNIAVILAVSTAQKEEAKMLFQNGGKHKYTGNYKGEDSITIMCGLLGRFMLGNR